MTNTNATLIVPAGTRDALTAWVKDHTPFIASTVDNWYESWSAADARDIANGDEPLGIPQVVLELSSGHEVYYRGHFYQLCDEAGVAR